MTREEWEAQLNAPLPSRTARGKRKPTPAELEEEAKMFAKFNATFGGG